MVCLNKYSFCYIRILPRYCIKTNLRENRFFAAGGRLASKNASHNVNIYAEKKTKIGGLSEFMRL